MKSARNKEFDHKGFTKSIKESSRNFEKIL